MPTAFRHDSITLHSGIKEEDFDALTLPVSFHADITTPSGTALGGTVDITLFSDGRFSFNVHMHDSGFDPYDFRVRCAVQAPGGLTLLFQTSGHTDGTGSNPFGHIHRDFDHNEDGQNALIKQFWIDVRASSIAVSKSYEDSGLLHTIEDIAKDLLAFLVADVTFGAGLALVIAASAEMADALDASFVGPGGLVGVVVAGGVVWVFGPSAIIAAVVAGVAAGAITDAMISHRQITSEEYQFAVTVFGNTLPPMDKLYLTNLSHGGAAHILGRISIIPWCSISTRHLRIRWALRMVLTRLRGSFSFMRWRMHGKSRRSRLPRACSARSSFRPAHMIQAPPAEHGATMDWNSRLQSSITGLGNMDLCGLP